MSSGPADPSTTTPMPVPHCYRHPTRETLVRCVRCDRPICPDCMHEASVGFQCPDDVAAGRRTQRAPRNALGARLRQSPPWITGCLVLGNVVVYLLTALPSAGGLDRPEFSRLFQDWQLLPYTVHAEGSYYRLLTAAFLHANLLHIAVNMVSLVFVGPVVEQFLGRWRFAALYLLGALGGSSAVYAFGSSLVAEVGASGAIFALLGACLVLARRINLDMQWLVATIVLNFVLTFSVAGISKLGHIGGFLTGIACAIAIAGLPRARRRLTAAQQGAGLGAVLAVLVLIVGVRTATF